MSAPVAVALHCPPGTKMLLEVGGFEDKLQSHCVGHVRGRFVIVQMPVLTETRREAFYQLLYPDAGVIARYLHEGTVIGFSVRIIRWIQVPFPLVFLTYPARLESYDLRRHRRVACCIPVEARLEGHALSGMLLDLSLSGCQFSTRVDAPPPAIAVDDTLGLRCELFGPAGEDSITCSVMRVSVSGHRLELGLRFHELPPQAKLSLTDYLQAALALVE